jgi:DNA-binding IclR family transcriptional regulator
VQDDDTYMLGMKLFEPAHEFPPMSRLLRKALPRMEALSKTVDQSRHLSVLGGPRQLVVAQVDTPGSVGFSIKIGATLDLLKSASGRVLLAFQDEEERHRLISLAEPRLSRAEKAALIKTIKKVAAQGFAFMESNQFSGVEAISYPILDLRGYAIAALTVPYVARLDATTPKPASAAQAELAKVAADLNAALGGAVAGIVGDAAQATKPARR